MINNNYNKTIKNKSKSYKNRTIKNIKLPLLNEFKESTYFNDMIQEYKHNKIIPSKITKQNIIDYMNKLNTIEKKMLINEIKKIKEYKKLKNKINFQPLSIEIARKKYWNSKTKKWKTIKSYYGGYPNDYRFGPIDIDNVKDRNNRSKVFCDEFTPNGDLVETDLFNNNSYKSKIYKNWLQSKKLGPYKYKNYNYKNKQKLYFLNGKRKYCNDDTLYNNDDMEGMQICEGNYISHNCSDGPSWIEVNDKDYI